jgi:hypothetical protein
LGIVPDRRLESEIRGAIADAIEIYDVQEKKAEVNFGYVTIDLDAVGGRVLYVVLVSELETHKVPMTGHLHDIKQFGHINRDEFESNTRDILSEFNLNDDDIDKAVKECVRVMRREKLITR